MSPECHPSFEQEKACYDWHENDVDDAGYRTFLNRLAKPLVERLEHQAKGLDYGCGPGPALAVMLREQGFDVAVYDPIYQPDKSVFDDQYDFISCTEVVEHFHRPLDEFSRLDKLLKPGALLAIMTSWYEARIDFATWHYRRDPTHVCFYRQSTLRWLATRYSWLISFPAKNVAIMEKALEPERNAKRP